MQTTLGFIGLGAMGGPMASNLLRKGFPLAVFDVLSERIEPLESLGAEVGTSCRDIAERCPVVITMLPGPADVKKAVLGANGVLEGMNEGSVLIDMSTIDPITTREIAETLARRGVGMLDAPVARGVPGAVAGTLAIFVGGSSDLYNRYLPFLEAMGTSIHHVGDIGCGEVVKLVNNIMVSVTTTALAEAMVLGVKGGVKPGVLFEALASGSANSYILQNHYRNKVMEGRFEENVFPIDYMVKDLNLALETGIRLRVPLHHTAIAAQQYILAGAAGEAKKFHPSVVLPLERLTGVELRWDK